MMKRERDELCHWLEVAHDEDSTRVRQELHTADGLGRKLPHAEYIWKQEHLGGNGYRVWDMAAPLFSLDLLRAAYRDLSIHRPEPDTYRLIGMLLKQTGVTLPTEPLLAVKNSGVEGSYCTQAEPYFYASWSQVLSGHRRGHGIVSVYHTPGREPILFRKSNDASTALTLQPMEMERMPLVPGTIVSLAYSMNSTMTGEKAYGRGSNRYRLRTYELPPEITLGLGRLSAWAYNDAEKRRLFATECYGNEFRAEPSRARFLAETTLNDFHLAAHHIMELCGVTPQRAGEEAVAEWSASPASFIPRTLAG